MKKLIRILAADRLTVGEYNDLIAQWEWEGIK